MAAWIPGKVLEKRWSSQGRLGTEVQGRQEPGPGMEDTVLVLPPPLTGEGEAACQPFAVGVPGIGTGGT